METEKHRCEEQIRDSGRCPSYHACGKTAKVQRDGKWYCGIHDPEKVAERRKKQDDKWHAGMKAAREERRRREAEQNYCANLTTEYLETHGVAVKKGAGDVALDKQET